MSDIAVRVENLGKKYRIGGKQERYSTLRDSLVQGLTAPFRRVGGLLRGDASAASDLGEEIWALRDVSFEIKHGDVVGIIGRNGAGKSTLLKILSQITEPTTGRIEIYGRVGALLEVGTGFHPELTGRENVFLNGAILGMTRREIERKFDEIVDFSGVEKFLDTPVKHYSSGMQMRLAFAVAAHLDPEILIVDEVLAVGDAEFQKKCMGKMGEVARGGRTVLFVSHNMAAVTTLTQKCLLLSGGKSVKFSDTESTINLYISSANEKIGSSMYVAENTVGDKPYLFSANLTTSHGGTIQNNGEKMVLDLDIYMPVDNLNYMAIAVQIFNSGDMAVTHNWLFDNDCRILRKMGHNKISLTYTRLKLNQGRYFFRVHIAEMKTKNKYEQVDCCYFEVHMLNRNEPDWGWHASNCQYHDEVVWGVDGSRLVQDISSVRVDSAKGF